jgi:glycosyltransferase involved in cell wall biosynthesis
VNEILSCNDPDIEVIILDNGSTDKTLINLKKINDNRLFIYSNCDNKGALFSMVNVLSKATGKYLVYSTDQDFINASAITDFKIFLLSDQNISCGYCNHLPNPNIENELFTKGYDAVSKVGYLARHPSGYFFNREMLESTNYLTRFSDYDFVDLFPFEFIFAELALMGNAAVFNKQLSIPETRGKIVSQNKSSTTNGTSSKAFFTPTSRLKMAINYTKHINQLELSLSEKKRLMLEIFVRNLISATIGYKSILRNSVVCEHYYLESRNLGLFETISIGWNFYKKYYENADLIEKKTYFHKLLFSCDVASIFFDMIIKKIKKLKNY